MASEPSATVGVLILPDSRTSAACDGLDLNRDECVVITVSPPSGPPSFCFECSCDGTRNTTIGPRDLVAYFGSIARLDRSDLVSSCKVALSIRGSETFFCYRAPRTLPSMSE